MDTSFTTVLLVHQTPREAFRAINNVRGWWTENTTGRSEQPDDVFEVHFGDVHYSKQQLVEWIPEKKVVWLVTESHLSFLQNKSEWTNTRICFEISPLEKNQTQIRFTHQGLVASCQCYGSCSHAWSDYINNSLYRLITEGKGQPSPKETMVPAQR